MIKDFFPIPVYMESLNLDIKDIADYCLKIKNNAEGAQISNRGGWQSHNLTGEHSPLNSLFQSIANAGKIYGNTISYNYPLNANTVWININNYKDYNIDHIHPHSVASGVYFVKARSGDLVLRHPAINLMGYNWASPNLKKYTPHNSAVCKIPPVDNTLIIFPGWLSHHVEANLDKKDRISISFNLDSSSF
jgi:uncharacterized protein (TIGR02466 family)